jgi:hypothetical protein
MNEMPLSAASFRNARVIGVDCELLWVGAAIGFTGACGESAAVETDA